MTTAPRPGQRGTGAVAGAAVMAEFIAGQRNGGRLYAAQTHRRRCNCGDSSCHGGSGTTGRRDDGDNAGPIARGDCCGQSRAGRVASPSLLAPVLLAPALLAPALLALGFSPVLAAMGLALVPSRASSPPCTARDGEGSEQARRTGLRGAIATQSASSQPVIRSIKELLHGAICPTESGESRRRRWSISRERNPKRARGTKCALGAQAGGAILHRRIGVTPRRSGRAAVASVGSGLGRANAALAAAEGSQVRKAARSRCGAREVHRPSAVRAERPDDGVVADRPLQFL